MTPHFSQSTFLNIYITYFLVIGRSIVNNFLQCLNDRVVPTFLEKTFKQFSRECHRIVFSRFIEHTFNLLEFCTSSKILCIGFYFVNNKYNVSIFPKRVTASVANVAISEITKFKT